VSLYVRNTAVNSLLRSLTPADHARRTSDSSTAATLQAVMQLLVCCSKERCAQPALDRQRSRVQTH
jgi:hypothetical protein